MMIQRAGMVVGLTAALVAYSFVGLTMLVMRKRIPILRRQLRDEGKISCAIFAAECCVSCMVIPVRFYLSFPDVLKTYQLFKLGIHYQKILFYDNLLLLGVANGCAEDALSLAETVASFGAIELEEDRYASALARVSKSSMKVRYSFSLLKLMQSIILGTGAGILIFVTWKTSTTELLAGRESVLS
jgi:hypothetical protein